MYKYEPDTQRWYKEVCKCKGGGKEYLTPTPNKATLIPTNLNKYFTGPVTGYSYFIRPGAVAFDIDERDIVAFVTSGIASVVSDFTNLIGYKAR